MSKKQPIIVNGQKVGRLKASWMLFKESWKYLSADKEMLWIPFITGIINLVVLGILGALFYLLSLSGVATFIAEDSEELGPLGWAFVFCCYAIGAFTLALSQAGITNTVYTRLHNGDATLGDSLRAAFSHWRALLLWSLITATVGLVLRMIAERSKLLGRIVIALVGVAWSVLTYFVVPSIVLDRKGAMESIKHSGQVFRQTWGESIVSNVSLGLSMIVAYVILFISFIGLIILLPELIIVWGTLLLVGLVALSLINAALEGVLKTLLYLYAIEKTYPPNFNKELLDNVLVAKNPTASPSSSPSPIPEPSLPMTHADFTPHTVNPDTGHARNDSLPKN